MTNDLLTCEEAAAELGVSSSRIRQLVAAGTLTAQRIGRRLLLVDRGSVAIYATSRRPAGWPKRNQEAHNG